MTQLQWYSKIGCDVMNMFQERTWVTGWWIMKWRVQDIKVYKRKPGERLWEKFVKL